MPAQHRVRSTGTASPRAALVAGCALVFALFGLGAELRYAEHQGPAIVNPLFTTSMSEARVNELVFEGLFTDDKDLRAVPLLAETFDVAPNHLSMRVKLRTDVRWHDGEQFTADDVVFTIKAMQDKETLSTESGRVAWIQDAVAEDSNTVLLTFLKPEPSPEEKLYFKILPKHSFTGTAIKRTDTFRNKPIGTGPYRMVRFNSDSSISMAAYKDYRRAPGLAELTMREVSDQNYQAKLLLYESLEALVRVLPRDLAVLQQNRKVALYPYQTNSWWYLGFNMKRAPFDDVRVREALALMIDRASLLAPVGTGDLLSGPFVKSSPFYNHDVPDWKPDEDRADALLREAGYTLGASGWINKAGEPIRLRITAHKALETSQEVVINLQSQLRGAGIAADVNFLDDASWKGTVWKEHNFDVLLSQWSFDRNEDVREQLYSTGTRNFLGYANPAADGLLDKARDATDPATKKAALRQLHTLVHNDVPMVTLWTLDSYSAMTTRAKGVVVHPFYFFTWVGDWKLQ